MSNEDCANLLDERYERVGRYERKFPRDRYEIRFLASKAAMGLLHEHSGADMYISQDPFECSTYLLGHRMVFVDADYIPSVNETVCSIQPVICCRNLGDFPMAANPGDYIYHNGFLKQVERAGTDSDGARVLYVRDVRAELYDDCPIGSIDYLSLSNNTVRFAQRRNQETDSWVEDADTTAIKDYLSSLTIT